MAAAPSSRVTLLRRFTLLTLATSLVIAALFGTILSRVVENFALRQEARAVADRVLEATAFGIPAQDLVASSGPASPQVRSVVQELLDRTDIRQITLWNARGELLHHAAAAQSEAVSAAPPPGDRRLRWRLHRPGPGPGRPAPVLEVGIPVMAAEVPNPVGFYRVMVDLSALAPSLARLIWSVQLSVVLGVLILYVVLFTIVRQASLDLDRSEAAIRGAFIGIIRSLVNALDLRDMATAHHSSRVADNAEAIGRLIGLPWPALEEVRAAAFLHDIGKIGIPDGLLTKEGPLTAKEREIIQRHTVYGYDILEPVGISPAIKLAVRHSHERWDGRGYPDGLAGEAIPLAARIVAVADAFEALTTERPYRRPLPPAKAAAEIARNAGSQFDPKVVDAALRVWGQLIELRRPG